MNKRITKYPESPEHVMLIEFEGKSKSNCAYKAQFRVFETEENECVAFVESVILPTFVFPSDAMSDQELSALITEAKDTWNQYFWERDNYVAKSEEYAGGEPGRGAVNDWEEQGLNDHYQRSMNL